MKEIARTVYEIQATPGRNDKLALLESIARKVRRIAGVQRCSTIYIQPVY